MRPFSDKQVLRSAALGVFRTTSSRLGSVLAAVWLVAAVFAWYHLNRGWVPIDDGTLAQSAFRVLQGQLPHRDFVENYTGGMSYYHALAFRVLGTNLMSLRIAVFGVFLASIPAVFYIASRLLPPFAAGAVTLLAVAWGSPNYPAAMPSWYNLFFAIFGIAALFRYIEDPKSRWLFLAGLAGGISCLAKIIGLYYVAAVLLFLVFHEQSSSDPDEHTGRSVFYRYTILLSLSVFVIALWSVFGSRRDAADFVHFTIPGTALVMLLIWREFHVPSQSSAARFRTLLRLVAPFAIGFAVPVAVFVAQYWFSRSTSALAHGVFRAGFAHIPAMGGVLAPPHPILFVLVLPIVIGIAATYRQRNRWIFAAVLAIVLAASFKYAVVSRVTWASAAVLAPLVVIAGVVLLLTGAGVPARTSVGQQRVMVLVSAAAMCSLVQFPFAAPIYFCYFAPVLVLAIAGLVACSGLFQGNSAPAFLLAFYLLFAVLRVTPSHMYATWNTALPLANPTRTLQLVRTGGLRVAPDSAEVYERLIPFLQQHAQSGSMIAIGNCAELYFLSGVQNATRDDYSAEPAQIMRLIASNQLKLLVLNTRQVFTPEVVPVSVRAAIAEAFPNAKSFGAFEVYWRP